VCGDRELIRRALENVISNSVRYAPAGTAVETILEKSPSDALLTVRDYGPGVPEELLPRLFTPFFRADASRDGATGGVGLGLAIAQRAIHLHHGSISARNAEPGLKVEIRIPLGPRV
jgi:two-component system sensor histidine kinase CpxA